MAQFRTLQSSFASGMVSPKFNGCSDLSIYKDSVEELINMYPTEEGGARTRENFLGFYSKQISVLENADAGLGKRTLIPYIDAKGQSYIFVFSYYLPDSFDNHYLFTYKWEGWLWIQQSLNLKANTWRDIVKTEDLQWVYVGDSVVITTGVTEPLVVHRPYGGFGDFTISYLGSFLSDSNPSAPLTKLNDAIGAMHYPAGEKNMNPNFLLSGVESVAATSSTHAIWALTFKDAAGTNINTAWNTTLTTYIKITNSDFTAIFKTRGTDATNTTATMKADLIYLRGTINLVWADTAAQKRRMMDWFISPWDNINGYPKCVTFFNGRLILAATNKYPSSIWCSREDSIYRFNALRFFEDATTDSSGLGTNSDGDTATSAFGITQGTTGAFCGIQWLHVGLNGLAVGTTGGVEIHNSGNNGGFKVGNTASIQPTSEGCSNTQPVGFSGSIIYVARDKKRIIMLGSDGRTVDLTALCSDYLDRFSTYDSVRRIVINESLATLSILTQRGELFNLKLNVLTGKWGFSYYEMNWFGDYANFTSDGKIDIALVSITSGLRLVLAHTIKSNDGYINGYLTPQSEALERTDIDRERGSGLDCPFAGDAGGAKVVGLPSMLRNFNYQVGVWFQASDDNGWYYEEFAPGSFTTSVTLSKNADSYYVGYPFRQRIKSLDLELGGSAGSTGFGGIKRIDSMSVRVWNTISFFLGSSSTQGEYIVLAKPTDTNAVSKKIDKPFISSPDRECRVVIENRLPVPMYFSALVFKGVTQE